MRQYTDSADAIKAYAEEVNFDFSKVRITELSEGVESQRGGLSLAFNNFQSKPMVVTIVHTWLDTFQVTFWTNENGSQTIDDVYFPELIELFKGLKVALTGVSHEEWLDIIEDESLQDDEYLYKIRQEEE